MPCHEKFSQKFDLAFSSQNRTWDVVGLEGEDEEDALERKGLWDGVDLHLDAMMQLM